MLSVNKTGFETGAARASDRLAAGIATEFEHFAKRFGDARRVLLIGGGGYIGAPVAAELLMAGHRVRNLDLFLYGTQATTSALMLHPHYELMVGDFADAAVLDAALADVTDVVILGGLVGDPITKKFPRESALINEDGVQRCLDALGRHALNKVILISTCSNYGLMSEGTLATEESELHPLSAYARAKVAAERHFLSQTDTSYCGTVLRFATAFGVAPRMRFDLTVNEFTRDLFAGEELVVYDADTWRPYCHVRDFGALIRRVLDAPAEIVRGQVFNAGGDVNNHTKRQIVDTVLAHLPDRKVSYQAHGSDPRNYRVDFSKVRETLGFTPSYRVDDGVRELIDALEKGFFSDFGERRNFYVNDVVSYAG